MLQLGTDYITTNNATPGHYTNATKVIFTVTAKRNKISGSFTFNVNVKGKIV